MKARTIEQLMTDLKKEAPELKQTHYDIFKRYLIAARNEVTVEKVTRQNGPYKEYQYTGAKL